jgi:hypothetical protein
VKAGAATDVLVHLRTVRVLLAAALLTPAALPAQSGYREEPERLRALIPLGAESFRVVRPWKGTLTLMGLAENEQFCGWTRFRQNRRYLLRTDDGERVRFYPEQVDFRITASLRANLGDPSPVPLTAHTAPNDYLLGLRFRVAIFHGLHKRTLPPAAVDLIGVPADVDSDERVYRVSVNLPRVPMEDRVVLEVLSPRGERIAKFHLDLI